MEPEVDRPQQPAGSQVDVDLLAVAKGFCAAMATILFIGPWALLVGFAVIAYEKRRHRAGHPGGSMEPEVDRSQRPAGSQGAVDFLAVAKGFCAVMATILFIGPWALLVGFAVIAYEKRRHRAGHP
jgi:general stress protein CsbA